MDPFFKEMTLTSYLERLANAQRQAALMVPNNNMNHAEFIDWVRDPIEQWLEKQRFFSENFPVFLLTELHSLLKEPVIDTSSLRIVYQAYLSTVIENHTKSLGHLMTVLKNFGFRSRNTDGRIEWDATLIIDTLFQQAYQKRQIIVNWHPEAVMQEFRELFSMGEREMNNGEVRGAGH